MFLKVFVQLSFHFLVRRVFLSRLGGPPHHREESSERVVGYRLRFDVLLLNSLGLILLKEYLISIFLVPPEVIQ